MSKEPEKYFSNSKEELEYYKSTYKSNAEELLSCKSKIKDLENINNKLKEKMNQTFNNKITANESSKVFFTEKEFKKQWESIIQTELIDCFDFCIKEYKLIANICQDLMLLVYEETKKIIDLKCNELLNLMNIPKTSKDKKESFYSQMLPFFRENFNKIFELKDDKIQNIKNKLNSIVNQYNFISELKLINFQTSSRSISDSDNINNNNNDIKNIIENKIKGNNFEEIIKSFYTICLYMILHDPILSFDIDRYPQRKLIYCFYNKKEHINLEGFGNDRTPCIIILQPPAIKKIFAFNGLRPAVYILTEISINSDIYNQCLFFEKKKEEDKLNKLKEYQEDNKDNKNYINDDNIKYNNKIASFKEQNNNKNDIKNNNYIKKSNLLMKDIKPKENSFKNRLDIKNISTNINFKNKIKIHPNQKNNNHNNNILKNKTNYMLDYNLQKNEYHNLSYGNIPKKVNNLKEKNLKINYIKTASNEDPNYYSINENINIDINKMPKKEQKNTYTNNTKNKFLNSSQKIKKHKDKQNNNSKQYNKDSIYDNNWKKFDNIKKNFGDFQLDINKNNKNFEQKEKIKKINHNQASLNLNNNKIISNYKMNQEKKNRKEFYNNYNSNYNANTNIIDNNINHNVSTPSSEKINIKYYSSLGNILNNNGNNMELKKKKNITNGNIYINKNNRINKKGKDNHTQENFNCYSYDDSNKKIVKDNNINILKERKKGILLK